MRRAVELPIGGLHLDARNPRLTVLAGLLRAQIAGRPASAQVFYGIRTGTRLRNHIY